MWIDLLGNLYGTGSDPQPGWRLATDAEVASWQASLVTLQAVTAECARRIDLAVTDNQKLNMLGSMTGVLLAVVLLGQTATAQQQQAATAFIASMQWIAAMKAQIAGLVGNVNYTADASWPVLDPSLAAFAAKF